MRPTASISPSCKKSFSVEIEVGSISAKSQSWKETNFYKFVRETDIRAPPTETSVLVNLTSVLGRKAEAKCLSVNSRRPEQIAVGANDPFVRVFDRRKLKAKLIEVGRAVSRNLIAQI